MLVVPQQEINILDNNISDNPEPIWDSGATYNQDDLVQYNNYVYKSLIDNNTGNNPEESLNWFKVKPINRWACFDGWTDTQLEYSGSDDYAYYEVETKDVDYIAFFDLFASKIVIELFDINSNLIETKSVNTISYFIRDWWEWTYNAPEYKKNVAINLSHLIYGGKLKIYIYKLGDVAKVSNIAYGKSQDIGVSLYGARVSRRNIIEQKRGENGRVYTSLKGQYRRISVPIVCDNTNIDHIVNKLADIASKPTLFIADEREKYIENLIVYGIYKDFDIPISVSKSKYEIIIEGVG